MNITKISGREIVDCCGEPALECEIILDNEVHITASVPSGTSRSAHEATELRDGGDRLFGKGLLNAIGIIEQTIAPLVLDREPDITLMDAKLLELDNSPTKSLIGGNVMLAVSSAVLKAQALIEGLLPYELIAYISGSDEVTLPFPMFNIINGGAHADNNLRIQEFMIVPIGENTARSSIDAGMELFHRAQEKLHSVGIPLIVGLEGGFANDFPDDIAALDFVAELIEEMNDWQEGGFAIALDVAASQFYDQASGLYHWGDDQFSTQDMIKLYEQLVANYPIYSIEDGLSEYDWDGWTNLTSTLGDKIQIVGDDLFATNPERILYGIQKGAANAAIIKPNQIGTITQTLQAVKLCKEQNLGVIFSHRSVETEDTLIIDLAVGTSASQLKAGGLLRGERCAKYNHLLRIEDRLTSSMLSGD